MNNPLCSSPELGIIISNPKKTECKLTEERQRKLVSFRKRVDPLPIESDHDLLRFLEASKWDVNEAVPRYADYVQWRTLNRPDLVGPQNISEILKRGGVYHFAPDSKDMDGNFLLFMNATAFDKNKMPRPIIDELVMFTMEHCRKSLAYEGQRITVVIDMKGVKWRLFWDKNILKWVTHILISYYPEMLARCIIVNYPPQLTFSLDSIKSKIPSKTWKKIVRARQEYLYKHIDRANLPKSLTGLHEDFTTNPWVTQ